MYHQLDDQRQHTESSNLNECLKKEKIAEVEVATTIQKKKIITVIIIVQNITLTKIRRKEEL